MKNNILKWAKNKHNMLNSGVAFMKPLWFVSDQQESIMDSWACGYIVDVLLDSDHLRPNYITLSWLQTGPNSEAGRRPASSC